MVHRNGAEQSRVISACPRVLHILPNDPQDASLRYSGSVKDTLGRTEYFQTRGISTLEINSASRSDSLLLKQVRKLPLEEFHAVVFEYPLYPRTLRFLRIKHPSIRLVTRAHNAEFLHRLHYADAKWRLSSGSPLRQRISPAAAQLRYSLERLRLDFLSALRSDWVLPITHWELTHYWRFLAPQSKLRLAPFFMPRAYLDQIPSPLPEKENLLVSLAAVRVNEFIVDASRNFANAVNSLGDAAPDWEFILTDAGDAQLVEPGPRLRRVGHVSNPFELLARARALAIFSDYGFGFKTKVLDAILCSCFVLAPPKLISRLPEETKPFCIAVNPHSPESLEQALQAARRPFPAHDINAVFRAQAYAALDTAVGLN